MVDRTQTPIVLTGDPSRRTSGASAGRAAAPDHVRGGKSGLHGKTVPDNVRRGRPQGKCHRKQTAAGPVPAVRVKRCGKSAPRTRRRGRHGKPHREQDRIGATGASSDAYRRFPGPSPGLIARGGRQRPSQRNGRHVGTATSRPYRTRLTGRLTPSWLAERAARPLSPGSIPVAAHRAAMNTPAVIGALPVAAAPH